jgi:hypothetical protein
MTHLSWYQRQDIAPHPPLTSRRLLGVRAGNLDVTQHQVVGTSRRLLLVFVIDLGEFGIDDILVA